MKTVLKGKYAQMDRVRALSSQLSYTVVMMNMKLLAVVTQQYIYQNPRF